MLMGFAAQGDFGPYTMYTSALRGSIVIFLKAWLKDPTSPKQKAHRDRVREAAHRWKQLTKHERETWELATKRLRLGLNGYNLFVSYWMVPNYLVIQTIERQSGLTLLPLTIES